MIELAKVRTDGGTQSRAAINEETVAEYAEAMRQPETVFPPVIVYYDGREYWLADGFHRVEAWREVGRIEVPADVRQGDRRQAILHSCAANAAHGLRRTNADKRRAVMTLLEDAEWSQWSDAEIARRCMVSRPLVADCRSSLTVNSACEERRTYTTKHGTEATMNTANIGGSKPDQETLPNNADGAVTPEAFAEGTSGGGVASAAPASEPEPDGSESGAEPEPAPDPYAEQRKGLDKFMREGLEDELIEARIALAEKAERLRAETAGRRAAERELKEMKAEFRAMAESRDLGPEVSRLMAQVAQIKGARDEERAKAARLQRRVNAQDAEIKKLRKEIEAQEVPL